MPLTLGIKAQDLLGDLPPYERGDPSVQGVIAAIANELQRVEDTANEILYEMYPQNATDTYGILSYYERLLKLPVAPPGQSVEQRRATVMGYLISRKSAAGSDWVAAIQRALGENVIWTHEEGPGDYIVTIHLPYEPGGYQISQVLNLARAITPAHLDLRGSYNEGFLIGISEIGVESL